MVYTEISQSFASRPLQDKANLTEHIFMLERQIHEIEDESDLSAYES